MSGRHWSEEADDGQTVLDPDERVGLRQTWVSTRADLNSAEQENIRMALGRIGNPSAETILDDLWLRELHHRLVAIHPFVNGNGRLARAAATCLSRALAGPDLTWGMGLGDAIVARRRYLDALRQADHGDLAALIDVIRS